MRHTFRIKKFGASHIRRASLDDAARLAELGADTFRETYRSFFVLVTWSRE